MPHHQSCYKPRFFSIASKDIVLKDNPILVKPKQVWTIDRARNEVDGVTAISHLSSKKFCRSDGQPLDETGTRIVRLASPQSAITDLRRFRDPYSAAMCSDGFACASDPVVCSFTGRDPGRSRSRMAWNIT
jgi:hypothetical protein